VSDLLRWIGQGVSHRQPSGASQEADYPGRCHRHHSEPPATASVSDDPGVFDASQMRSLRRGINRLTSKVSKSLLGFVLSHIPANE